MLSRNLSLDSIKVICTAKEANLRLMRMVSRTSLLSLLIG
ncbi:hypothetical protein APHNP_0624 [Anaplasma phagocytophilum str. ApNP]|uniref:Uncharacterized protein n=1 Tax=Anaplasma phagocytophilum str. ApNP TaxID=1359153 RepID=A0A0F3NHZ2_ANAPH|nr:hypothetical protein APHNP_0624 [Anaplasma phagocytophilum str. ApNP]